MKDIYDEAMFELNENVRINGSCIGYNAISNALERAKKENELLGLYRNLSMETEVEGRMYYWQDIDDLEKELEELK